MTHLAYLRDVLGFDLTTNLPFTNQYRLGCSACETLAINGVPTHERGCPHAKHECHGCNAIIPMNQRYCEDCR